MSSQVLLWSLFGIIIILMLAIDLGVVHREEDKKIGLREALIWSAVWIGISLLFNVGLYFWMGYQVALEFLTGYLIEKSLSVDNLFVFLMIFSYFGVPSKYQHKVLFWGIIGAVVMRAIFIFAGVALIHKFHWIIYVFGAFLVYAGVKMALQKDEAIDLDNNPVLRLTRKYLPITDNYEGNQLTIRRSGKLFVTPLFVVLILVETTDVFFALDSIPAILAITRDTFIVLSSNIFAILGLRALYFALAGTMERFHYLKYGLAFVLVFVGVKMLTESFVEIPVEIALGVIGFTLTVSIVASLLKPRPSNEEGAPASASVSE